jgi:hypothetical protein
VSKIFLTVSSEPSPTGLSRRSTARYAARETSNFPGRCRNFFEQRRGIAADLYSQKTKSIHTPALDTLSPTPTYWTMTSRLPSQLYRGVRQLITWAACRPNAVALGPALKRFPFSTDARRQTGRDDELLWKTFQDSFDESDSIEKGKDIKNVSFFMDTEKSSFNDAIKKRNERLARMALVAERVESICETKSSSFITDMSREELSQKSFSDDFDESDAIETGKLARIALVAERVESIKCFKA